MIQEHQEDVKPPRACELCLNKQAVWYCASDDAFLCRVCDESVHSANQVATKHERVCLRTSEISNDVLRGTASKPVWHSGFRRKARTPRVRCDKKPQEKIDDESRRRREDTCVPEIGSERMFFIPEKQDDDLASLVPEFQGFTEMGFFFGDETDDTMEDLYYNENEEAKPDGNEQTLMNCKQDCKNVIAITTKTEENEYCESNTKQRNMLLRLNYEDVIAAWDKQESPRDYTSSLQLVPPGVDEKKVISKSEREARVWRYRDKRKNRLFEKKIRYEVRKVNADKRPRMKGRFVRRSLTNDS